MIVEMLILGYVDAMKTHLQCYMCKDFGNLKMKECGNAKNWPASMKNELNMTCPSKKSDFCFKRTMISGKVSKTRRGCLPRTTRDRHYLKEGCVETLDKKAHRFVTCFCTTNLCNRVSRLKSLYSYHTCMLISLLYAFYLHHLQHS